MPGESLAALSLYVHGVSPGEFRVPVRSVRPTRFWCSVPLCLPCAFVIADRPFHLPFIVHLNRGLPLSQQGGREALAGRC